MENKYIDLIEKINDDYLKLSNLNRKKSKNKDSLIFRVIRKIKLLKIPNSPLTNQNFSEEQRKILNKCSMENKKVVIYSAIVGDYDNLLEPLFAFNENIDYVMFSNNSKLKSSVWKIKSVPSKILKLNNNTLINRYIKFHPKELFGNNYDYSIYIDGNIMVVSDLSPLISLVNEKYGLALHKHYARDCVYDEAEVCIYNKKGSKKSIIKTMNEFKKNKFPRHYGLLEAPIIISDLSSECSLNLLDEIYEMLVKTGTLRDQLCIPYILWKNGIRTDEIGTLGNNVYLNPKIRSISHK